VTGKVGEHHRLPRASPEGREATPPIVRLAAAGLRARFISTCSGKQYASGFFFNPPRGG